MNKAQGPLCLEPCLERQAEADLSDALFGLLDVAGERRRLHEGAKGRRRATRAAS